MGLGLAGGFGAGAAGATLGDILKQKFLEQIQRAKLAEDMRQADMQQQVQQAQLGLGRDTLGQRTKEFDVTSGQNERRLGMEESLQPLRVKQIGAQTANTEAQTGETLRKPTAEQEARAFTEGQSEKARTFTAGENVLNRANAVKVAGVRASTQTGTGLSDAAIDQAARSYLTTGAMPALGMGAAGTRIAIMNRAGEIDPVRAIASAKANYASDAASQRNLQQTADTLSAFKHAAKANMSQFESLMAKLPDSGAPLLNTPLRQWNLQGLGSEQIAAAEAARQIALREVARVTNNPRLTGQLSDAARHEVENLIPANATIAQIRKVMPVLLQDMDNVERETRAQLDEIKGRISAGGPGGAAAPAGAGPADDNLDIDAIIKRIRGGG